MVFCVFCTKCIVIVQDHGYFRPYFLIKILGDIASLIYFHFFTCVSFVHLYSVDVVEAAPSGAAEDHWSRLDMQT